MISHCSSNIHLAGSLPQPEEEKEKKKKKSGLLLASSKIHVVDSPGLKKLGFG